MRNMNPFPQLGKPRPLCSVTLLLFPAVSDRTCRSRRRQRNMRMQPSPACPNVLRANLPIPLGGGLHAFTRCGPGGSFKGYKKKTQKPMTKVTYAVRYELADASSMPVKESSRISIEARRSSVCLEQMCASRGPGECPCFCSPLTTQSDSPHFRYGGGRVKKVDCLGFPRGLDWETSL